LRSPGPSISADASKVEIGKETTYNICATVQFANTSNKTVKWESSKPDVATVDADGNVTAKWSGKATITARISGTDIFDTCVVTVPEFGPGVEFDTLDDAVWDFAKTQYNISRHFRLEVGALFYEIPDEDNESVKKYAYTDLVFGYAHSCDPFEDCDQNDLLSMDTIVAAIHTHPNNSDDFLGNDEEVARKNTVPFYVVTYMEPTSQDDEPTSQDDEPTSKVRIFHKVDGEWVKEDAFSNVSHIPFLKYDENSQEIQNYAAKKDTKTGKPKMCKTRWETHQNEQAGYYSDPDLGYWRCGYACHTKTQPGEQV